MKLKGGTVMRSSARALQGRHGHWDAVLRFVSLRRPCPVLEALRQASERISEGFPSCPVPVPTGSSVAFRPQPSAFSSRSKQARSCLVCTSPWGFICF